MTDYNLLHGDCLELMKTIQDKSIDMILCDLPYGVTANSWDTIIPFDALWTEYNRICKGPVVLTSNQPFSAKLIMSNINNYNYDWVWVKNRPSRFLHAKRMPLRKYEQVLVFNATGKTYNPQNMIKCNIPIKAKIGGTSINYNPYNRQDYIQEFTNYPSDVIYFDKDVDAFHPTQKPVALMEYLINTYTNSGETVLDNCMGSGTTGVACINTNRTFIGIEKEHKYFEFAKNRIETHEKELDVVHGL